MARFHGKIGYAEESVETKPGIWKETIVEFEYTGDVIRNTRRLQPGDEINSDISVGNSISILADAYAIEHIFAMRFVEWSGTLWIVSDVEVQRPRLLLRLGGVYHGPTAAPVSP